jgi:hypothetical protein
VTKDDCRFERALGRLQKQVRVVPVGDHEQVATAG